MMSSRKIFSFKDEKVTPDPVLDYPADLVNGQVPLIIDNGMAYAGYETWEMQRYYYYMGICLAYFNNERNSSDHPFC